MTRSLLRLISRAERRRKHAAMAARLADFNDHLLADIGLSRDRIAAAAARGSSLSDWRRLR